jgi:hypothetical protein
MSIDVECEAGRLYDEVDADTYSPPGPRRIAKRLELQVRRCDGFVAGGDAVLVRWKEQWIIFVRRNLSEVRLDFAIAHEIAEWHLARLRYREEDVEDVCDALAGAIVAPRDAYRCALRDRGTAFEGLAHAFRTTQTCVALRLGEVTGRSLVLLAPRIRVRGDLFVWPNERELRRIARAGSADGLEVRRLTDDRKRAVLLAA